MGPFTLYITCNLVNSTFIKIFGFRRINFIKQGTKPAFQGAKPAFHGINVDLNLLSFIISFINYITITRIYLIYGIKQ